MFTIMNTCMIYNNNCRTNDKKIIIMKKIVRVRKLFEVAEILYKAIIINNYICYKCQSATSVQFGYKQINKTGGDLFIIIKRQI